MCSTSISINIGSGICMSICTGVRNSIRSTTILRRVPAVLVVEEQYLWCTSIRIDRSSGVSTSSAISFSIRKTRLAV